MKYTRVKIFKRKDIMHRKLVFFLVGAWMMGFMGCSEKMSREDHRQAILETRNAWGQAIAEGDMERIFSFWTEDAVIYPVSEPAVRGKEAIRKYVIRNRTELGLKPKSSPLETVAAASGDLGYTLGTYEWINSEGKAVKPGRYLIMWRKNEKGEWKCFMEIHSPLPNRESEP